jgi:hypothetical protein
LSVKTLLIKSKEAKIMKKRLFTVLLMLVLCVGVLSITALADGDPSIVAQGTCGAAGNETNVTWVLTNDGTITISGTGAMADFEGALIPWDEYRSETIKSVVIGNGVTNVGIYAFADCRNNASVTLGGTVAKIGKEAFRSNSSLSTINLGEVITVENGAFSQCNNLASAELGKAISIGSRAFYNCTSLTSITASGTVNERAFENCTCLATANLSNVTSVGNYAFNKTKLSGTIDLSKVTAIGSYAFDGLADLTSVTFGNGLTTINEYAFRNTGLTAITLPNTVTTLGMSSFENTALTEIDIPSSVTIINNAVFKGSQLKKVTVPATVTTLGSQIFMNCTLLTEATIQAEITVLPINIFGGCSALTKVTLPESLVEFKNKVFAETSALETITIPKNVTIIGSNAFLNSGIKKVYYGGTEAEWALVSISDTGNEPLLNARIICSDTDVFPEEKPVVTAVVDKKTGKIKLTITAVNGAKSYKIFVSEQPNGTYKEAATVTGTTYTYSGTPGKTYYFKVQAVNDKGELSGESNIVSKVQLPAQVTGLKATSKKKQVTLKWKKVTGAKKYFIYMSKNGKSGWKKVGTTTKTTYVYKKGTVGKKLYFRVQAVTANGKKGEFSKVVSVKVKK